MSEEQLARAVQIILDGGVICHACEGVWGFSCDPFNQSAVCRILDIKKRSSNKGLIVIGHNPLAFGIELKQLNADQAGRIVATWPGHVTWVVPNVRFPKWITGPFSTVAIRVPGHQQARQLAAEFGNPLVSTSANAAGDPSLTNEGQVQTKFGKIVDFVLPGEVGLDVGSSSIRDALSGDVLR